MNKPTIGLGILSWRSHKTLTQTLDSYERESFFSLFDQQLLYFNGICPEDRQLAQSRGLDFEGGENCGIARGMEMLAQSLRTDYVLLLQNDCPLVESLEESTSQLAEAVDLLERGTVQIMRMRHRFAVGEGFSSVKKYLEYYSCVEAHPEFRLDEHPVSNDDLTPTLTKTIKRLLRPKKARRLSGRSIYLEQNPERLFSDQIQRTGDTFVVDSEAINFTDQSFLVSRKFFLETLMEYIQTHPSSRTLNGYQVPEICLNCDWWRRQHFQVGQARGLFTHNRFDGSFRREHSAYEANLASTDRVA